MRAAITSFPCGAVGSASVIRLPAQDVLVPDAVYDPATSLLHIVYGTSTKQAFYVQSADLGASFSRPLQLNGPQQVTTTMGERGPKISLGYNASLHVIWMDLWAPGVQTHMRAVNSYDGGRSFSTPVEVAPSFFGIDGVSAAADPASPAVAAVWHVNNTQQTNATSATWLYTALSVDGGRTFGPPQEVAISPDSPSQLPAAVACSMCMTRPRARDGMLHVAFRSAVQNVRSFYLLTAPMNNGTVSLTDASSSSAAAVLPAFQATEVNPSDDWVIEYCPMNGPEMSLSEDAAVVAFMTGDANNVFWSTGPLSGAAPFTGHVPTPLQEANERYPTAVLNSAGDVLFVWNVGPMAITGTAQVKYACYNSATHSVYPGQSGTLGTSTAGTKATALVAAGANATTGADVFLLITSAT